MIDHDRAITAAHPLAYTPAIWHPTAPHTGPIWMLFRRDIILQRDLPPATLWVSASQRLRCWWDGRLISEGPPRSDRDRERWGRLDAQSAGNHLLLPEQT